MQTHVDASKLTSDDQAQFQGFTFQNEIVNIASLKIKFTADSAVVNVVVSFHFFRTSFQETQPGVARTRNELELS